MAERGVQNMGEKEFVTIIMTQQFSKALPSGDLIPGFMRNL